MSSSRLSYRALEATHTKTRRLAYITAMVTMLGRSSLPERLLLAKMLRWSQEHQENLANYWVQTGAITSTRRNSAGARYLDLARRLGIVASISGECRLTRIGLTLFALTGKSDTANPFFLTSVERLFYSYLLLREDADVLLTLLHGLHERPGSSLASLQKSYQQDFTGRLALKGRVVEDEQLKQQLLERRLEIETGWKNPEKYAEHIVPPRLNWLLDLGVLDAVSFQRNRYYLTDAGITFASRFLQLGQDALYDVSEAWLSKDFWHFVPDDLLRIRDTSSLSENPAEAAPTPPVLCDPVESCRQLPGVGARPASLRQAARSWEHVSEAERQATCAPLLREAFAAFQHTMVPKISLTQVLLYMSARLILENNLLVSIDDLKQWLSVSRVLGDRRYEVRLSPQENVSYIVLMPA